MNVQARILSMNRSYLQSEDQDTFQVERIPLTKSKPQNEVLLKFFFSRSSHRPLPLFLCLVRAVELYSLHGIFHPVTNIRVMTKWVTIRNEYQWVVILLQLFKSSYAGPSPMVVDVPERLPLFTDELYPNTHAINQQMTKIIEQWLEVDNLTNIWPCRTENWGNWFLLDFFIHPPYKF